MTHLSGYLVYKFWIIFIETWHTVLLAYTSIVFCAVCHFHALYITCIDWMIFPINTFNANEVWFRSSWFQLLMFPFPCDEHFPFLLNGFICLYVCECLHVCMFTKWDWYLQKAEEMVVSRVDAGNWRASSAIVGSVLTRSAIPPAPISLSFYLIMYI